MQAKMNKKLANADKFKDFKLPKGQGISTK